MLSHPTGPTDSISRLVLASGGSREALTAALLLDAPADAPTPCRRAADLAALAAAVRSVPGALGNPLPAVAAIGDPDALLVAACAVLADAEGQATAADPARLGRIAAVAQALAARAIALGVPGIVNRLAHRALAAVDAAARRLDSDVETLYDDFVIARCLTPRRAAASAAGHAP